MIRPRIIWAAACGMLVGYTVALALLNMWAGIIFGSVSAAIIMAAGDENW